MPNNLSPELLAQLYTQESSDPFLILVTLSHADFSTVRLVNNSENVVSRGNTFMSFPMRIVLPVDDGESDREVSIEFDNVSRELIEEIRSVTTQIDVTLEMILASTPDVVQMSIEELKIGNLSYNQNTISAKLYLDNFLSSAMTSEKYTAQTFPGIF